VIATDDRAWREVSDGLLLAVRVTPKGGRDALDGVERMADGQCVFKFRVRAAAADGGANEALRSLVARTLGVPPSQVSLVSGARSRLKRLKIQGDVGELAGRLQQLAGEERKS